MRYAALALLLLTCNPVFALDDVTCDPANSHVPNAVVSFQKAIDIIPNQTNHLTWDSPNNLHTPEQIIFFNNLRVQLNSLSGINPRYWKCYDSGSDGIIDSVREMTQAEKDAIDAPTVAAQAAYAALETEITTNNICTAELAEIDTRINAAFASASTAAQIKTATIAVLKKIARCVRARTVGR